jgi:hypothetical protein
VTGVERCETPPVTRSDLQNLSDRYEEAEAAFLDAVRQHADRASLASAARLVASTADAFNSEAWRKYHAGEEDAWMPLGDLTERTEVLVELWTDLAAAHEA